MAIITRPQMFAIMGLSNQDKLGAKIANVYPNNFLALSPSQWLVLAPGTAKELCDAVGISDGTTGSAVVVSFTSYYGRASTQIWEWVASRMGAING